MTYTSQVIIYARETWDADPVSMTIGAYSILRESCPELPPFEHLPSEDECQMEYRESLENAEAWGKYREKCGSTLTYDEIKQIEGE